MNEAKKLFHPLLKVGGISTLLVAKLGKHTANAKTVVARLSENGSEAHTQF